MGWGGRKNEFLPESDFLIFRYSDLQFPIFICPGETRDNIEGFEDHFQYIEIPIFPKKLSDVM